MENNMSFRLLIVCLTTNVIQLMVIDTKHITSYIYMYSNN